VRAVSVRPVCSEKLSRKMEASGARKKSASQSAAGAISRAKKRGCRRQSLRIGL
jgi:hypothetical protein